MGVLLGGFLLLLSALSYIIVPVFLGVLLLVWLLLSFLSVIQCIQRNCQCGVAPQSIQESPPSLFLLSSLVGSHASACNNSTGNVLNVPVYIFIPSLCMLSSSLVSLGGLYYTTGNHNPSQILYSLFKVLRSPPHFFPLLL